MGVLNGLRYEHFQYSGVRVHVYQHMYFKHFSFFIGPMCTWGPIIGLQCLSVTPLWLKPCEDLVKTVNVVNVVKI